MSNTNLTDVFGVGRITAERLISGGIETIGDLARADVDTVADLTGFPTSRVENVLKEAAKSLPDGESSDALEEKPPVTKADKKEEKKKDKKKAKKKKKKDKKKAEKKNKEKRKSKDKDKKKAKKKKSKKNKK